MPESAYSPDMAVPVQFALRRFVLHHRRVIAACLAGLAVLAGLSALEPSTPGSRVVVAGRDLASGSILRPADLSTVTLPPGSRPAHSWSSADELLGRHIAAPVRKGEVLTDRRLLGPSLLDGYDKGLVLATVRLAESSQLTALRVGDNVNVIATDPEGTAESTVVARRVEIVALPRDNDDGDSLTVALVVPESVGLRLASAGLRARLSVLSVP